MLDCVLHCLTFKENTFYFVNICVRGRFGWYEASLQTQLTHCLFCYWKFLCVTTFWCETGTTFAAVIVKQRVCTVEAVMSLFTITQH